MLRTVSPILFAALALAACGAEVEAPLEAGAEGLVPTTPSCWISEPVASGPRAASARTSWIFAELRWGQGLDALERMLEPHVRAPEQARWARSDIADGVEVRRTGRVGSNGVLALTMEVFDLDRSAVIPLERWSAHALATGDGWRFKLADRSGLVTSDYVRWGSMAKGCGAGLAFRISGDRITCWDAAGSAVDPARCRALERRLAASGA